MRDFETKKIKLQAALGDFIITWNQADNAMRNLLVTICKPSPKIHILTAELETSRVGEFLKCILPTLDKNFHEPIKHLIKLYNILREYRNYFVHGIYQYIYDDQECKGFAQSISAKSDLKYSNDFISIDEISIIKNHCTAIRDGAYALMDTISPLEGSLVNPPLPSPKIYPLPNKLKKKLSFPLRDLPQRQS